MSRGRRPTPALDCWRRRGDTQLRDDLWRAAAWEAAAVEADRLGWRELGDRRFEAARAVLLGVLCRGCGRRLHVDAYRTPWDASCRVCELRRQAADVEHPDAERRATAQRALAVLPAAERYVGGLVVQLPELAGHR